ncbi:MAG: NAD-dependent epimerase/dehydratase family protein [Myxococcales bacterium]|nr:NAD-dependent epimerase/dehydratase family protein [Myxococcales bacterium]
MADFASILSPVLVTGANGFIGSELCRVLRAHGCAVRGLALPGTPVEALHELGVEVFFGDVCDPASLAEPCSGARTVFHLAALARDWGRFHDFMRINAEGTGNMLEAARRGGARRFVHMSSLAVHRFRGYRDGDESVPADNVAFGYCASKVKAEALVRAAHSQQGMHTTIIRPGAIIHGPGDTTSFIHLAPAIEAGGLPLVDGGRPLTCFSFSRNLAEGMLLAAASPAGAGETFVLADEVRLTIREHLEAIARELGVPGHFRSVPAWLARAAAWVVDGVFRLAGAREAPPIHRYRVGLVARDFRFHSAKARSLLGYAPCVPYDEAIRRTVAWYREWRRQVKA